MPLIVSSQQIDTCLRKELAREGFTLSSPRLKGETGVDLVAERSGEKFFIEIIGYKKSGPARAKDFYEGFFRTVSRLNEGAEHVVLAVSTRATSGLPLRARQHRVAWERIARAFPELEIWFVDIEKNAYTRSTWDSWLAL